MPPLRYPFESESLAAALVQLHAREDFEVTGEDLEDAVRELLRREGWAIEVKDTEAGRIARLVSPWRDAS